MRIAAEAVGSLVLAIRQSDVLSRIALLYGGIERARRTIEDFIPVPDGHARGTAS